MRNKIASDNRGNNPDAAPALREELAPGKRNEPESKPTLGAFKQTARKSHRILAKPAAGLVASRLQASQFYTVF